MPSQTRKTSGASSGLGCSPTICQKAGRGKVEQGSYIQESRIRLLAAVSWHLGQSWWEMPKHLSGALHVAYFRYEKLGEN